MNIKIIGKIIDIILLFILMLIDIKNLNRRSYKGLDDYGGSIAVGDGYYNDAYEDEDSKRSIKLNWNEYHFYKMILPVN